jgi:hypothetical protein
MVVVPLARKRGTLKGVRIDHLYKLTTVPRIEFRNPWYP